MYANLFGDTVKGKNFQHLPDKVQQGILLHRKIDDYIDRHPGTLELKRTLFKELPKVSGVAIDLFFDHLLAKNWSVYSKVPYNEYLENFYQYNPIHWNDYTDSFREFIMVMRDRKWINYYPLNEGLIKSCQGVSSRISFPNELYKAPESFFKHEQEISKVFHVFMSDARDYLSDFI